jgi:hypothetical protein
MGFEHLVDELRNSVAAGKITPEALGKMNMEQAVRHVAEVNALRAVESNKARAMDMTGMPIHKEYPESGMSWRQLKQTEEGQAGYDKLKKWLKDEGDTMRHCVGGYCDDVASGASEIYSLRDAKGKPSVTIETDKQAALDYAMADDVIEKAWAEADRLGKSAEDPNYYEWMDEVQARIAAEMYPDLAPRIVQIKGPNNKTPDPQYFPMIQDFIRSGKWFDIKDADNTGLTPAEIQQILKGSQ